MISRISIALVVLAAAVVAAAGCAKQTPAAPDQPPPTVTVCKPVAREVTEYFEFPGETSAVGEVEVRPRVTGHIVKVNFEDGQDVKQGDLLFEIDPRPYEAALDRAKGELGRLKATLAKAELDVARGDRLRPSGAISVDEYEQHVAQLAVCKASIATAEAAIRDAQLNLEFTRIVSPINGRVSRRRITEGNLVQPGSNETNVLTTVVTTDPIYVYFNIDDNALLQYQKLIAASGRPLLASRIKDLKVPVEIGLANEQGFPHRGVLDFLDNQVHCGTGTIRARGVFENADRYLAPGLFARVRLPFGKPHQALLISDRAIGTDQKLKYVLKVNEKQIVQRVEVELGAKEGDLRVVKSGRLKPDDRVIVKGLQRVRPGLAVTPEELVADSAPSAPVTAQPSDQASRAARN